eukprot:1196308-Prorocentrum_minimum.AAC.4
MGLRKRLLFKLSKKVYPSAEGTFVESFYGSDLKVVIQPSGTAMGVYNGGKVRWPAATRALARA